MALPTQPINLPFTRGVDTKTDKKLSAKPAVLENALFKGGTLQKRYGNTSLTTAIDSGGNFTSGQQVFPFNSELVRLNNGSAYSLGPQQNNWTTKAGAIPICTHDVRPIARKSISQTPFDHAYANGITVTAWIETGGQAGLHIAVYDEASGDYYQTGASRIANTASAETPRCVAVGNTVLVVYYDLVAGGIGTPGIRVAVVDTTTPEATPTLHTLSTSAGIVMGDAIGFGGYAVVAYTFGVALSLHAGILAVNAAGAVLSSPVTTDLGVVGGGLGGFLRLYIDANKAGYLFILSGTPSISYLVFNPSTFATTLAETTIATGTTSVQTAAAAEVTPGNVTILCSGPGGLTFAPIFMGSAVVSASAIVTAYANISGTGGMAIQCDGMVVGGKACCVITNGPTLAANAASLQPTMFVLAADGTTLAKFLPGTGATQTDWVSRPFVSPAGDYALAVGQQGPTSYTSSQGAIIVTTPKGIARVNLRLPADNQVEEIRLGDAVYIGGSLPKLYDGKEVVESGHNLFPEGVSVALSGAAKNLSDGQYQWRVVYTWISASGELQRSAPSPAVTATATAGQQADITIPTQRLCGRDIAAISTTQIEVYRTEANGTLFYRVSSPTSPLSNNINASTVSYTDATVSDADLVANELLYTTGGVNDCIAPPGYRSACEHKTRLVVLLMDDSFAWQSSSQSIAGQLLRFNESWGGRVPTSTGPLVGCASMDGNLFLFTTDAVYLVSGDGPDLLGNNNWPPPQVVTSCDSGAISQQSIVSTNVGVFFQGAQGYYLLDRGLGCEFIGADVAQYGHYPVRSAVLMPNEKQVRYQVDDGGDLAGTLTAGGFQTSNGGLCLVYDYFYRQWSVLTNYGAASTCLYRGKYTRMLSNGTVRVENPGTWDDGTQTVSTVAETAWIKTADIQGFQRVKRMALLGTYASDCTIRVSIAYNYDETFTDVSDFVGNGVLTPGGVLQFRKLLAKQKCEAIKFRFEDLNISGSGQGMALTGLTLEVGVKGGTYRLPASQST
jgi:hypothetical protein